MTTDPEQLEEAHMLNCELAEELRIVDLQMKRDRGDPLTEAEAEELEELDEAERRRLEEYPRLREEFERIRKPLIASDATDMDYWPDF